MMWRSLTWPSVTTWAVGGEWRCPREARLISERAGTAREPGGNHCYVTAGGGSCVFSKHTCSNWSSGILCDGVFQNPFLVTLGLKTFFFESVTLTLL